MRGGFPQAQFLQRLWEPYDNNVSFAIVALGRLHEKELLEFDGTWVVGGRLSQQESGVAVVQGWNCGAEPTARMVAQARGKNVRRAFMMNVKTKNSMPQAEFCGPPSIGFSGT